MSLFPRSPRLVKVGIVVIDPDTRQVIRIIPLQYNPDSLTRTFQVQAGGSDTNGNPSEALMLKGLPIETIRFDAELDATDLLEMADSTAVENGINPTLSALETLIYPSSAQLHLRANMINSGILEVPPWEAPFTVFVWGRKLIVPVRITEFSVTEEAFDSSLNPIRAKVSIGMRVLSVDDLGFNHLGGSLYMMYLQEKEQMAARSKSGALEPLGLGGIP